MMKNLQNLNTGDEIIYLKEKFCIVDWLSLPEPQYTLEGDKIYALPILNDGRVLDWIYWNEVTIVGDKP